MNIDTRLHDTSFLLAQDARLRALARRLVHDAAQADDVVQEVWLQALRGSHRIESRIGGWLSGITRHVAFGKRREDESRERRERHSEPPSLSPSPADLLARESARRAVVESVMQLAEPMRTVIVLRFFDDLSSRRIAARLGVPVETVRTRLKRALEQLRADLDRKHGGDGRAWCSALAPILALPQAAVGAVAVLGLAAALLVFGTLGVITFMDSRATAREVEAAAIASPAPSDAGVVPLMANSTSTDAGSNALERTAVTAASDVFGRVVDEQGRPIADAHVVLSQQYFADHALRDENEGTTKTLVDGHFRFAAVPLRGDAAGAKRTDKIFVSHAKFVGRTIVLDARSDLSIALRRRVVLEGAARDAVTHAPLEGIPIALQKYEVPFARVTLAEVTTLADGRYAFDVAPESDLILCARPSGAVPTLVAAYIGHDPSTTVDIDFSPTRSVELELRAFPSGAPLADVRVAAGRIGFFDDGSVTVGVTDANGRCVLASMPVCGLLARASDAATGITFGFVIPPAERALTDLPLVIHVPEPWTVRGRLIDSDGAPIAGASVSVAFGPRDMGAVDRVTLMRRYGSAMEPSQYLRTNGSPNATTADDGSFELIRPVFAGDVVRLSAARRGSKVSHFVATLDDPRPGSTHDIGVVTIKPSGSIFLHVVYAPTNVPFPIVVAEHASRRATWTSDRGATFVQSDLEPGTWTLTASAPGLGASEPTIVEVVAEERRDVVLNLATRPEDDPVTSGVALDVEGRPLPHVQLDVIQSVGTVEEVPTDDPVLRASRKRPLAHWLQTDDAGRFEFRTPRVLAEDLNFTFSGDATLPLVTVRPGSSNVVVRKLPTAHFCMRLVDAGGASITTPITVERRLGDAFETMLAASGFSPSANGIFWISSHAGPSTLRIRREHQSDAEAVVVDLDVRTNDEATAPMVTLR